MSEEILSVFLQRETVLLGMVCQSVFLGEGVCKAGEVATLVPRK